MAADLVALLRLALGNVRRRARESVLVATVVFVASTVILAQLAQAHGVQTRARRVLVDALSGDYLVTARGGPPVDVLSSQLDEMPLLPMRAASVVDAVPASGTAGAGRLVALPRLRFGALVSSGDRSIGLNLQAVSAGQLRRIAAALELGPVVASAAITDSSAILLSDVFARYLGVAVGDTIVVLASNREGYLSDGLLVVRAVFSSRGVATFLTPVGFVPYTTGRDLVHVPPDQTMELVLLRGGALSSAVATGPSDGLALQAAADRLTARPGVLSVTPWRQTAPLFSAIIDVWRGAAAVTQTIFAALSFLLFLNVVLSKVNARRREVGTLYALGFSPRRVMALIVAEYLGVTLAAGAASAVAIGLAIAAVGARGIPVAAGPMEAAYMGQRLYPELHGGDFAWVLALFAGVACVGALLPMLRFRRAVPAALVRVVT